jgi:hypothetical protein
MGLHLRAPVGFVIGHWWPTTLPGLTTQAGFDATGNNFARETGRALFCAVAVLWAFWRFYQLFSQP